MSIESNRAAVVALVVAAGCAIPATIPVAMAAGTADFARTIAADPRGQVAIGNVAGSVTITGWDRPEVDVKGRLGADVERVEVQRDGRRVSVKVIVPSGRNRDGAARLDIRVPKASSLELNVVSADVSARAVSGGLRASLVSGNLDAEVDAAPVAVRTVSGDVLLTGRGQPAEMRVETVSGDLRIERAAGRIEAQTVSGDMNLVLDPVRGARMRTTSGDVQLAGRLASDASVELESVSGDANLRFPGGNYAYEVKSFSGDITTCFGAKPSFRDHGPGSTLEGVIGSSGSSGGGGSASGGARVRVRSMSGDVALCDR